MAGETLEQLEGRLVNARVNGANVVGTLWIEREGDEVLNVLLDMGGDVVQADPADLQVLEVSA